MHAQAVQLVVAHVEAGLALGLLAQLLPLLVVEVRVPSLLKAVPCILGTLEGAEGYVHHQTYITFSALVAVTVTVRDVALLAPRVFQIQQRVLKRTAIDHADILAFSHLARYNVVKICANLFTAWTLDLKLGSFTVHGLKVGEGGAGVIKEPGFLQLAALPRHVRTPVTQHTEDLAAGAGTLGQAPLLARRPGADPILGRPC